MKVQLTKPLFAWDCLEDSPSLKTVRQFLEAIPEVSLAYQVTSPKAGDGETLPSLLEQAQDNLPEKPIQTLADDKATNDKPLTPCTLQSIVSGPLRSIG